MAFAFAGALGDPPLLECFKVRFLYPGQQAGVGNGEAARRGGAFLLAETVGEAAFKRTKPSVACGRVKAAFGMESGNERYTAGGMRALRQFSGERLYGGMIHFYIVIQK